MISPLSIDPATLFLTFQAGGYATHSNEILQKCYEQASSGTPSSVNDTIRESAGSPMHDSYAHFVTTVWHEKRHFLDLVLTNYGASRTLEYFHVYTNLENVLFEARSDNGVLFCPMHSYLDPTMCRKNKSTERPKVEQLAKEMRKRQVLRQEDRTSIGPAVDGSYFQAGGEAQLEALAYHNQHAAAFLYLDTEGHDGFRRDLARIEYNRNRYDWAVAVGIGTKLISPTRKGANLYLNLNVMQPLLFASLCIRGYGQTKTEEYSDGALLPINRFDLLLGELLREKKDYETVVEAWLAIQIFSKRLWGRSIIQELEADFALEGKIVERLQKSGAPVNDNAVEALQDFHELRGELIDYFREDPMGVIDPYKCARDLLPKLNPFTLFRNTRGIASVPPEGFEIISGFPYDARRDEARWYWSAMNPEWPINVTGIYRLKRPEAWSGIASWGMPLARLMINGHLHDIGGGPECGFATEIAKTRYGVKLSLRSDLLYRREDTYEIAQNMIRFREESHLVCDICRHTLQKEAMRVFSPWFFRYEPHLLTLSASYYGGGEDGLLLAWRDWSYWVVCQNCAERVLTVRSARTAWITTSTEPLS
jgi:hypothetical protein